MKTLTQIEPRIDIATLAGDATGEHIINQAGSYYLTGNLNVTKEVGIFVQSPGVTIDLNGFRILRTGGTAGSGIALTLASERCTVKNGVIEGAFDFGLRGDANYGSARSLTVRGVSKRGITALTGWIVDGCNVTDSGSVPTGVGISTGDGSTVNNCSVANITGSAGIRVGSGCSITGSTVSRSAVSDAIRGAQSTLTNCASFGNTVAEAAFYLFAGGTLSNCVSGGDSGAAGIYATDGSTLTNCSVFSLAGNPGAVGFGVGPGCIVTNCSAAGNSVDYGIQAGGGAVLRGFIASSNTSGASRSAGIAAFGPATITGCTSNNNRTTNGTPSPTTGVGISTENASTIEDCTVSSNHGDGIHAGQRCKIQNVNADGNGIGVIGSGISADIRAMVKNCSATDNQKNGIVVLGESIVADCRASHNGLGGAAAGIASSGGSGSRIEGNQARDNTGTGILGSIGDVIIRNTAGNNTVDYNPSSGPNFGPLQPPSATSNPTANIVF